MESAPPAPPNRQALWTGLVFGGLVLLLGATLSLAMYFASRKTSADQEVQASTATPNEEESRRVEDAPPDRPGSPPPNQSEDASLPPPPLPGRRDPPPLREPPPLAPAEPKAGKAAWLPPGPQQQVNKAIDKGVQYLKKTQNAAGGWGPRVGLVALPGLTLLECGVPAEDSHVQKAAQHIRRAIPRLDQTYDLALSILFLDRLGDPGDKKLIQTCALRLVAGQTPAGGWHYVCPNLTSEEERDLLTVLQQTRPTSRLDLFVQGPNGSAPPGFISQRPGAPDGKSIQDDSVESKLLPEGGILPLPGDPAGKGPRDPDAAKKALSRLPANLRKLAALQPPKQAHKLPPRDASDNSNTQFAILGLWAASRQGLPLERSLALVAQRFRKSEARKGGWGYQYSVPTPDGQITSSMTGAGLLGLAVGHGLTADGAARPGAGERIEDPAVEKGFNFLSQAIGKPFGGKMPRNKKRTQINMYFMWTTERVGVLFNRRQIGGKDWYAWGVELLLEAQKGDGSWMAGGYPGSAPVTDTCFALLFLKRANLAKDLTKKLEFFMEGKGLQGP
jgi:hypothetical protein